MTPGITVKPLVFPELQIRCPAATCGADMWLRHKGGGEFRGECRCGLRFQASVLFQGKEVE